MPGAFGSAGRVHWTARTRVAHRFWSAAVAQLDGRVQPDDRVQAGAAGAGPRRGGPAGGARGRAGCPRGTGGGRPPGGTTGLSGMQLGRVQVEHEAVQAGDPLGRHLDHTGRPGGPVVVERLAQIVFWGHIRLLLAGPATPSSGRRPRFGVFTVDGLRGALTAYGRSRRRCVFFGVLSASGDLPADGSPVALARLDCLPLVDLFVASAVVLAVPDGALGCPSARLLLEDSLDPWGGEQAVAARSLAPGSASSGSTSSTGLSGVLERVQEPRVLEAVAVADRARVPLRDPTVLHTVAEFPGSGVPV